MGGRLRQTLADEIHVTGVSGVVATKFVAFVIAATVAAVVVHGVTGEALAPAPVRARPLLAPVAVAYVWSLLRAVPSRRAVVSTCLRAIRTTAFENIRRTSGFCAWNAMEELRLAVAVLEKLEWTALRVLGPSHPKIPAVRQTLGLARGKLFTDVLPARSRRDA